MRSFIVLVIACIVACVPPRPSIGAYQEVEPGQLIMSPEDYVGRYITIRVKFIKIRNVYRGWEEQANLKQDRTIKFIAAPLNEIPCYANKTNENEEIFGKLRRGQELVISGHIKKCKMESRIKGERRTVKRKVKGPRVYVFMVKKVESVGEAPSGRFPRRGRRFRFRRQI